MNMKRYFGPLTNLWILLAMPLAASTVRIYVTHMAGDNVYVIDPVTNKVVQVIDGIEQPHGVNFSPDGSRVYVSNESENVLDVVDQKTGNIIKKVPLSGRPNNIAVTKDGGRVLVCIAERPGALDIIDTTSLERVKSIPMKGPLHNVYVTPDGKFAVMGSVPAKLLTVIDLKTELPVWELNLGNAVRNMAFETGPDGSTRRIFVTTSFLRGFDVVDFSKQELVDTIKLPDGPREGKIHFLDREVPCHGIGIPPDGKTLWINARTNDAVFVYSLPDLKVLGHVLTGMRPEWITFTPDSKTMYDSNAADNTVSVIDTKTLKEVTRIKVGQRPSRNNTLVLQ